MKSLLFIILASFSAFTAHATEIHSEKAKIKVARVAQLINLVNKDAIKINIVVEDLGGSTDMSSTQSLYLTLYSKGEMYSTDAAFPLMHVLALKSAKRVRGGIYEITVSEIVNGLSIQDITYVIDARKAVTKMKNVDCRSDFDCDDSVNFQSTITVTRK